MADGNEPGAEPERVIPPPPPTAGGVAAPFPPVVPLAPSLSGPPPTPGAAGAPLPPYATRIPPAQPAPGAYPPPPGAGYPPPGAGYPMQAYPMPGGQPAPAKPSNTLGIVLAVVGGVVVLAVVGVAVLVGLLLQSPEALPAPAAPTPSTFAEDPDAPAEDEPSDDEPSDDAPDADASGIAAQLEAKIEEYKRLRDSGALWQTIPDNEYNRTAVSAYLYLMTDMKVATIWGIDEAQAQEYGERMAMLEQRLLAQEPLGDNIKITLEDKVFTYNGETGEGGYTDK